MQGAPGWSIAWYSNKEQVLGIARVPTTVSLLVTEQHKIDQKYIPNQRFDVTISEDDDGNLVSDKTPEQILEAYNNGQIVSGVNEDKVLLSLIHANKTETIFFEAPGYDDNFWLYRIGTDKMVMKDFMHAMIESSKNVLKYKTHINHLQNTLAFIRSKKIVDVEEKKLYQELIELSSINKSHTNDER